MKTILLVHTIANHKFFSAKATVHSLKYRFF